MSNIGIVIPAYHEEKNIIKLVKEIRKNVSSYIVIIDDSEIILFDNKFKENIIFVIIRSIKSNLSPPKTPPNKLFKSPR